MQEHTDHNPAIPDIANASLILQGLLKKDSPNGSFFNWSGTPVGEVDTL
jgi:hypothetical protein